MPAKGVSSMAGKGQSDHRVNCVFVFVFALTWGRLALLSVRAAGVGWSVLGQVPLLQVVGL